MSERAHFVKQQIEECIETIREQVEYLEAHASLLLPADLPEIQYVEIQRDSREVSELMDATRILLMEVEKAGIAPMAAKHARACLAAMKVEQPPVRKA